MTVDRNPKWIPKETVMHGPNILPNIINRKKRREFNLGIHLLFIDYEKALITYKDRFYLAF